MSTLLGESVCNSKHFWAHMGENNSLGIELVPMFFKFRVIEMKTHGLFVEIALGDEKVGAVADLGYMLGPSRVASIGDDFYGVTVR